LSFLLAITALMFLMLVAYRGFSVILFAPVAAIGAVRSPIRPQCRRFSPAC